MEKAIARELARLEKRVARHEDALKELKVVYRQMQKAFGDATD